MKKINILSSIIICIILSACSAKNNDGLYNLSAMEWYKQIIKDLQNKNLEKADEHYLGMSSEHAVDPLLKTTLIILAQAHISEEQYKKADFYLEEYVKKFGDSNNIDYINYLKIKARFDSFAQPDRNQGLMLESQEKISNFLKKNPYTEYNLLVKTMLMKFNLAVFSLNENIRNLYEKTDRMQSYEIYKQRVEDSKLYHDKIIAPESPWYRRIFE